MKALPVLAGMAVVVLAACGKPPLDEQQKTALADSIEQFVAGPFLAAFEHPNVDAIMALYVPGNSVQSVENGTILPDRDSITKVVRAFWGNPQLTARFTLGAAQVAVLSRDAAVYSGMINGATKDSAGVESPLHFAWTGVFVRTAGGWKLQAEHSSYPPAPPAAPVPAAAARSRR
jgi:ketosteroid isomerase-like protein